jgi:hypothetical protein
MRIKTSHNAIAQSHPRARTSQTKSRLVSSVRDPVAPPCSFRARAQPPFLVSTHNSSIQHRTTHPSISLFPRAHDTTTTHSLRQMSCIWNKSLQSRGSKRAGFAVQSSPRLPSSYRALATKPRTDAIECERVIIFIHRAPSYVRACGDSDANGVQPAHSNVAAAAAPVRSDV